MSVTQIIHFIPQHRATAIYTPPYGNLPVVILDAGAGKIKARAISSDSKRSANLNKTR